MIKRNWVGLTFVVLIFANNGLFTQQEKLISASFQKDIERLMLEKNVPAIGIGIIEDGELRQVKVYGEPKTGIRKKKES